MNKYKSISLIETLISLTIVGISLMALLPVITVRKDANDPTKGNKYWELTYTDNTNKTGDITKINIGVGDQLTTPRISIGKLEKPDSGNFIVASSGFANSSIMPMLATEKLYYNGLNIIPLTTNNSLHIFSGKYSKSADDSTSIKYSKNLYLNNDITLIENSSEPHNYSFCKNSDNSKITLDRATQRTNFYSVSNQNDDNILVDVGQRVIGIGQNAGRYFPARKDPQTDFICIANLGSTIGNTPISYASSEDSLTTTLIIGTTKDYVPSKLEFTKADNYVIYKQSSDYDKSFKINANTAVKAFIADAVIVSSDKRLKNVYAPYKRGINEIKQVNPVIYSLKDDKSSQVHVGVIAQDLQKIFPNSVAVNQQTGYLMVSTDEIFYSLVNSIKTLDEKNKMIEKENKKLENKIAELRKIRDAIKASKGGNNE